MKKLLPLFYFICWLHFATYDPNIFRRHMKTRSSRLNSATETSLTSFKTRGIHVLNEVKYDCLKRLNNLRRKFGRTNND
jgi:hypothetical protein